MSRYSGHGNARYLLALITNTFAITNNKIDAYGVKAGMEGVGTPSTGHQQDR